MAYDITLDNHQNIYASSYKPITSKFNNTGIDIIHNIQILKEMAIFYAKLRKQYVLNYQLPF